MRSFTKTSFALFFLLINIACVTCPLNEELENVEVDSLDLDRCKMELFVAFKKETALDNFLYAFLNIDESDFVGREAFSDTTQEYYYDLLYTAQDLDLPELVTPQEYCRRHFESEIDDCTRVIAEIGCEANVNGIICIKVLYLRWKKINKPHLIPVRGTEHISDKDLTNAISRAYDRFPGLSAEDRLIRLSDDHLLEDYYRKHESYRKKIEHLMHKRETYAYRNRAAGVDESHFHRVYMEYDYQHQHDLREARYRRYGIRGNVSCED